MSLYARLEAGAVAELFTPPAGFTIDQCFAPGSGTWVDASSASPAPQVGWTATQVSGGWTFAAPAVVAAPVVVPQVVSAFQARAAMHAAPSKTNAGKTILDDANAFLVSPPADPVAVLAWEYATTFDRQGKFVTTIAPQLGLTDTDLDNLFIAAAAIQG